MSCLVAYPAKNVIICNYITFTRARRSILWCV